jgi:phosphodiesterase/alkaline phosphatase D-like protein
LATTLRWTGRLLGALALVVFLGLAFEEGTPQSADFGRWEKPAQMFALGFVTLGYLLSWRFEGLGGGLMATAGVAMGALASVAFEPLTSLFAALAFFVPGLLLLLVWQRTQTVHAMAALAGAMVILLAAGYITSDRIYSYYFGPTHPESSLMAEPVDIVEWIWAGGTTDSSVVVKARLHQDSDGVRLAVSEREDMTGGTYTNATLNAEADNPRVISFAVSGLDPATKYYYAVEADGHMDASRRGTFQTLPDGAASFTFAFASCARLGSNGAVYDAIREAGPLFFLAIGDWHYANIDTNDPNLFRDAYQETLTRPAQAALYRSTSVGYVWDDHDYAGNNSDGRSAAREAARLVYRESVPHYPLPAGDADAAIYQAFTVGRVRFIMTDTRSEKTPTSEPDGTSKSMLGVQQKEWLKSELLAARDRYPLIVWVNPDPWIDPAGAGKDTWGGYDTERREIADFIAENDITGVLMLSGDAHMLAIDDGTNSDFSASGGAGFPVFHAAALDKHGRVKGGPYSEGAYPGSGQFGLVQVDDDGGSEITVTFSGKNWKSEEIVGYSFTVAGGDVP